MGLTKPTNSPGLAFDFDHPRAQYSPGDVISGHVVLNTAADVAIGTVTVSFWGRSKSRIIQQHGQSASYHRGRTRFFHLEKLLYEGQYTHKPGSFSWPFEFVVPDRADPVCIGSGEKWKPKEHYRSNVDDQRNELDLSLPPSMFHSRTNISRKVECFIEYVLEATLAEPHSMHKFQFLGPKTKTSTYPVIFHPLSTPEPIQNYDLVTQDRLFTISTLKLLPEHAGTSLGIRDRARSFFHKDTVPRFSFSLIVQAPNVIQLFHPKPLPFLITIQPDLGPENTTIDTSTSLPEVVLRSIKIELKPEIRCRAPGTYADTKTYGIPILSTKQLTRPLSFTKGLSEESTLDLGSLYDLRVGNAKLGPRIENPLCPNFTSYNVTREYYLTWELEIECAERTERFSSPRNLPQCTVLLPPATACMDVYNSNALLGADLAQAASSASCDLGDGHSFWSRRKSGEGRGEKEKPSFGSLGLGSSSNEKKLQTKAEEAAEERQADFTSGVDGGMNADSSSPVSDQDFNARGTWGTHGADQPPPHFNECISLM
ncbi:hypothetical protein LTS15_006645 [Exophiala xenobiotica]|nr:hypothetical protein LTS15_006645 [Exophiala xenobiotica]